MDEVPDDDEVRESYNFAPGYYGAVYRADTPDHGGEAAAEGPQVKGELTAEQSGGNVEHDGEHGEKETKYKLQSMKWGLVPFWAKRSPDYGSLMRMRTINCRDDSLVEDRGMWTAMKKKKRCVVVCQGFYEWLKKGPSGKEKVPHFIKRKDDNLMCFAGLWDCVQYEGAYVDEMDIGYACWEFAVNGTFAGSDEKLYTYTIITTPSNSQLRFIHDRMPAILDAGSDAMASWLDPKRTTWTKELQSLLKPYEGELECYPVSKDVGKVGNNSPEFIVSLNSKENKQNIANFFGAKKDSGKSQMGSQEPAVPEKRHEEESKVKAEQKGSQATAQESKSEVEADKPQSSASVKREHTPQKDEEGRKPTKAPKTEQPSPSPTKGTGGRQMRSATSNGTPPAKASHKKAPQGTPRITSFFKK